MTVSEEKASDRIVRFHRGFGFCNDRMAGLILKLKDRLFSERIMPDPDGHARGCSRTDEVMSRLERLYAEMEDLREEWGADLQSDVRGLENDLARSQADLCRAQDDLRELQSCVRKYERHNISDPDVRAKVWALTDGHCTYCGNKLEPDKGNGHAPAFCVEHVVPRAAGGPDNLANYVPSCLGCNSAKGDRHVLTFIRGALAKRTGLTVVSGGAA